MPAPKTRRHSLPAGELPRSLKRSSKQAQQTFTRALASAVQASGEGDQAVRAAYAELERTFEKRGDHWIPKQGSSQPDRVVNASLSSHLRDPAHLRQARARHPSGTCGPRSTADGRCAQPSRHSQLPRIASVHGNFGAAMPALGPDRRRPAGPDRIRGETVALRQSQGSASEQSGSRARSGLGGLLTARQAT